MLKEGGVPSWFSRGHTPEALLVQPNVGDIAEVDTLGSGRTGADVESGIVGDHFGEDI